MNVAHGIKAVAAVLALILFVGAYIVMVKYLTKFGYWYRYEATASQKFLIVIGFVIFLLSFVFVLGAYA